MREVKIVEALGLEWKLIQETGKDALLYVGNQPANVTEVQDLVLWLEKEVLKRVSSVMTATIPEVTPTLTRPSNATVQQFPALEARAANKEIVAVVSAVKPGDPDPLADRRADGRGKYKQITDPRLASPPTGLEVRGGYVDNPIAVKL